MTVAPDRRRRWWHRRLDRDRLLGRRLAWAFVAVFGVGVPFTLLAVLVETAWDPLRDLDEGVAARLHGYALDHPGWVRFLRVWTTAFQPWTFRALVAVLVCWLLWRRAPRLAAWAAATMVTGGLLGLALKVLLGRTRPQLPHPVAHAPGASFPSGHALTAALGSGVLLLALLPVLRGRALGRVPGWLLAWLVAAVLVLVTGYTRIALGVHWTSDVLGGWLLGAGVVVANAAAFESWRRDVGRAPAAPSREGVEPEAAPQLATPPSDPPR